jgi:uncharacterized protein YjbJ (UPF0337 family)
MDARMVRVMDKQRIKGALDQAKGSLKAGIGRAIGSKKLEVEGKLERAKGKIEVTVGKAKDKLRGVAR